MADEEPKIIIDEDWKAQVEREREQQKRGEKPAETSETAPETAQPEPEQGAEPAVSLFDNLVASLCAQTMMALGVIRDQQQDTVMVDLDLARHLIDTIDELRVKTQGNLSDEESKNLNDALGEIKRLYVMRADQVRQAQLKQATGGQAAPGAASPGGPDMTEVLKNPDILKNQ